MNEQEVLIYNEAIERVNAIVGDYTSGVLKENNFIYYLRRVSDDISKTSLASTPQGEELVEAIYKALESLEADE